MPTQKTVTQKRRRLSFPQNTTGPGKSAAKRQHVMTNNPSQSELERLQRRVAELESEMKELQAGSWRRDAVPFYPTYLAWSGAVLGMIGAIASLLLNVVGSVAIGQHPLRIVQVYLTFPLGENALNENFDSGMVLAIGCCLYVLTGAVLAIPLQLILARFFTQANLGMRLAVGTVLGLLLWALNFYLLISWLQPWLFGGNWIVDLVPPWIGAVTHVVFAWVIAALSPWGTFQREESRTRKATPEQ